MNQQHEIRIARLEMEVRKLKSKRRIVGHILFALYIAGLAYGTFWVASNVLERQGEKPVVQEMVMEVR